MMTHLSDDELLRAYVQEASERAFTELVRRHLGLVYSVARRQVPPAAAEEVAQTVFLALARQARALPAGMPLVAWLHVVSRRQALNAARAHLRRQVREHHAATLAAMPDAPPDWTALEPLLDEAVEALEPKDRTAILLRFFEQKSLREVGAALGSSDDAAQKRVTRALEQMRAWLVRRGVTASALGLASQLSAQALAPVPPALAGQIMQSAASTGALAAAAPSLWLLPLNQKMIGLAALSLALGGGFWQVRTWGRQNEARDHLERQVVHINAEINREREATAAARRRLKTVEEQLDAGLALVVPSAQTEPADSALEAQMEEWTTRLQRLRRYFAARPEQAIPELQLLAEKDWFQVASTCRAETEAEQRAAAAQLRNHANSLAGEKIMRALQAYVQANHGALPPQPTDLAPFADASLPVGTLERYVMNHSGKLADVPAHRLMKIIEPRLPPDLDYDAYTWVGTTGYGNSGVAQFMNIHEAQRRFQQANFGQRAKTAEQLLPYLKWPAPVESVRHFFNR